MNDVVAALLPSVGVAFLFWLVVRAFIHADRREREAQARFEAEERKRERREEDAP